MEFPYTPEGMAAADQAQARMMGQPQMQPQMQAQQQPMPDAAWRLLWDLQMDEALRARSMADRPEMMQQVVEPLRGFRTPRGMDVAGSPYAEAERKRTSQPIRPLTGEQIQANPRRLETPVGLPQRLLHRLLAQS
jgi:hypothetical protein